MSIINPLSKHFKTVEKKIYLSPPAVSQKCCIVDDVILGNCLLMGFLCFVEHRYNFIFSIVALSYMKRNLGVPEEIPWPRGCLIKYPTPTTRTADEFLVCFSLCIIHSDLSRVLFLSLFC